MPVSYRAIVFCARSLRFFCSLSTLVVQSVPPFSRSPVLPFSRSPVLPFSRSPVLPFSHSPVLPFSHSPVLPFSHSPILPFSHFPDSTHHPRPLLTPALAFSPPRHVESAVVCTLAYCRQRKGMMTQLRMRIRRSLTFIGVNLGYHFR